MRREKGSVDREKTTRTGGGHTTSDDRLGSEEITEVVEVDVIFKRPDTIGNMKFSVADVNDRRVIQLDGIADPWDLEMLKTLIGADYMKYKRQFVTFDVRAGAVDIYFEVTKTHVFMDAQYFENFLAWVESLERTDSA